jgi:hypothetical protein
MAPQQRVASGVAPRAQIWPMALRMTSARDGRLPSGVLPTPLRSSGGLFGAFHAQLAQAPGEAACDAEGALQEASALKLAVRVRNLARVEVPAAAIRGAGSLIAVDDVEQQQSCFVFHVFTIPNPRPQTPTLVTRGTENRSWG